MLFDSFEAYDVQETRRISREEGKIESKVEDIIELLNDIGTIPPSLKEQIQAETNLDTLKTMHKLAAKSNSIEEFQEKTNL